MKPAARAYQGIVTATPTPLDERGDVDTASVKKLAEHLVSNGAAGIAPVGGTGEYVSLAPKQRRQMVDATLEAVGGRVPVIPGVLSPGFGESVATCREFASAGADALLVVTPYYARPSQEGIVDYFKKLSDVVDADLMLYEIPYRTGVSLNPETVDVLARQTRIIAMKACNQDLSAQLRAVELAGAEISILTGEENVFPIHIAMGARGGLLATSCLFPRIWNELYRLASAGQLSQARALHAEIMPTINLLYREHNPGPLKAALAMSGFPSGEVLAPLLQVSDETRQLLVKALPVTFEREKGLATLDFRETSFSSKT
ncbi:4-hydroxy-tetrahydrodipicolinate synthase [Bradyrhizobium sp. 1.29L]